MTCPLCRPPLAAPFVATAFFVITAAQEAASAPAPFDREAGRPKQSTRDYLVGNWTMTWAGQNYSMTLSANGNYESRLGGIHYVGSWRLDQTGRFWITESTTPENPHSWQSYGVSLDPVTLSGRVEVGCPGADVRLVRQRGPRVR